MLRFPLPSGRRLALAFALWLAVGGGAEARLSRGPYVQLATPESIVVVWRTLGNSEPVVRYGAEPGTLDKVVPPEAIVVRAAGGLFSFSGWGLPRLHSAPAGTMQYEARLTGLEPGAIYYYAVYDGSHRLAGGDVVHQFKTAPPPGDTGRVGIWVLGDSGTGAQDARDVYESMRRFVNEKPFPLDVMLHVGDMAYYDGTDAEFQGHFFEMYRATLAGLVCWPALGNHEGHRSGSDEETGPYFDAYVTPREGQAGGVPSGHEAYYSFDYGNIHFVSLNSYDVDRSAEGEMAVWLKQDLAQSDADWLVAWFHHPPYSRGSHDSDREVELVEMRENIMPLLEDAGVDLIFSGHSHIYERSMLIDGAYETPTRAENVVLDDGDGDPDGNGSYRKSAGRQPHEGTVAVVTGQGGGYMFQIGNMPVMRYAEVVFGSVFVEVEGDTLTARMITAGGEEHDRFQIIKRGEVTPERLTHPWQPLGPAIEPVVPIFVGETEVSFVSPTRWPDEEIRYTLDGTEPGPGATLYNGPITISSDVVVKARAFQPGTRKVSPVTEKTFARLKGTLRPPEFRDKPSSFAPGVHYRYFKGEWERLPNFRRLKLRSSGVHAVPSVEVRKDDDNFALQFSGYLYVPAAGVYGFSLSSDDGSRLLMGGRVMIDNDGLHANRTVTAYVGLQEGYHAIEVQYFERSGGEVLDLGYAGPGVAPQIIPPDAFWHHAE